MLLDFMEVAIALNDLCSTSSTLIKQRLLVKYGDEVDGFKEVLKFIYDPYFTTGLKQAKLNNAGVIGISYTAQEIMEYLRLNNTGTLCDASCANSFIYASDDPVWQWAATGLVTKDLQIGVSVTTLNKVYGKDFIPKIGIMRGMLCPEDATGDFIATEKIDGNRRLIFTFPWGPKAFTRSGKPDFGLVEILEEAKQLPTGYVFDCECVAMGDFADNIALRQASASVLNRGPKSKKTGVKALCFDMLPIDEYNEGKSNFMALARKAMLAKVLGDRESVRNLVLQYPQYCTVLNALVATFDEVHLDHIKPLPVLGFPQSYKEAVAMAQPIWDTGGEGLMLVAINSAYEVNPNPRKTLLKIKATKEYVCRCVDTLEGTGKYVGMLGAIVIEFRASDGNVYQVSVGSGFTDWQRDMYWPDDEAIVGKLVEIESFGESINAQGIRSLNCPIFKRIVGHED